MQVLDVRLANVRYVRHQVRNIALRVRELLLDVVVTQYLVDRLEHTRLVVMHVADTNIVRSIVRDGTQVDLGEVDRAQRGAR